ncbi:MAG: hypothetical protein K6C12_12505 [Oscillospiraceae bacterium]|nr:hypothetical protein [Oscillospiraceae bacterium]
MPDNQAQFHSPDVRRLVLVVEDEAINRTILGTILENDYDILFAENGEEALRVVVEKKELLSYHP